ncbi:DUF2326 domain-containing protein [Listeria sp. FSL L7-1509]|uniref:DUF2326 domain-containing protein n=1 Tax=Listeria immobilis TaxID=2713502 RepID=A0ABR6SU29_9LIST|nr:DUF2326 domain-containing protein [Listeria immobilis]MBC1484158.1 DUF2326 domain-containing protein [Listeria immobilis]MBC1505379.1 DUF2326 domain-containing protein [Listeria immobilis]MBC1509189.1 DUF2326 domain-containing protein [Listeria immobilis]MBC6313614.1 DUF2326 domain-containing protein [Listeria immobilis]
MYIKKLLLQETYPEVKSIREVLFKLGTNFIVDAGKYKEKGNGVGKTTALKLIDVCLGAKDKKYIYTDYEMDSENIDLKNYIHESKIQVIIELVDKWEDEDAIHKELKVDLFKGGKKYINGEKYKEADYWCELNKAIFNNYQNVPTFRQLIGMFVRINQKFDNNKFLKYLDSHTNAAIYENIYSYLFDLHSQDISTEILRLKGEIKEKEDDIQHLKKINRFKYVDVIKQKIGVLDKEIKELSEDLAVLIDTTKFKENEQKINEIKLTYSKINDLIDESMFKKKRSLSILESAKKESEESIDTSLLEKLYEETTKNFGKLGKTFTELVNFNKQLVQNKISYFEKQVIKWSSKIQVLEEKRESLFKEHKSVIMLIEDNKINEYTDIQDKLGNAREDLGRNKQIITVYNELNKELSSTQTNLNTLLDSLEKKEDSLSLFNRKFSEYSKMTNGEGYILFHKEKGFPLAIEDIEKGLSTGAKKSVIAAFDLAYQAFAVEIGKKVPKFIVHDVIETLDRIALESIVTIANDVQCQYIAAVLNEKIANHHSIKNEDIILTLSESERMFKM